MPRFRIGDKVLLIGKPSSDRNVSNSNSRGKVIDTFQDPQDNRSWLCLVKWDDNSQSEERELKLWPVNGSRMNLSDVWNWDKRKLGNMRAESGNPAADDLRERIAELAGVDLRELLNEMKRTRNELINEVRTSQKELDGMKQKTTSKDGEDMKAKKAQKDSDDSNLEKDLENAERALKEVMGRSHIQGAAQRAVEELEHPEKFRRIPRPAQKVAKDVDAHDSPKKFKLRSTNIHKRFLAFPESPPKRIVLEVRRECAKPLTLPDQDDSTTNTVKLKKQFDRKFAMRKKKETAIGSEDIGKGADDEVTSAVVRGIMNNILPSWTGDLFSTLGGQKDYLDGMIYLSRMSDFESKSRRRRKSMEIVDMKSSEKNLAAVTAAELAMEMDEKVRDTDLEDGSFSAESAANDSSLITDLGAKLYCATALCNWARNPANASRLANEDAVSAIKTLMSESHPKIVMFCAGALRFMSENPELAVKIIDEGVIGTMTDVINSANADEFVCVNFAVALINLTRVDGRESEMIEKGILFPLNVLPTKHPELTAAYARGLYNLTCVDQKYSSIDKLIRALVSLSSTSTTSNVKHICAAAICNLADIKAVRPRLVEENVIAALGPLARGSETRTRRVCAVILQNLSATKSCRVEMVTRNSVQVADGLSSDQDPIILRCIGLTLSRLAMEEVNRIRMIQHGGITTLCNIAVKYPTVPGISQPVAAALQLLSGQEQEVARIVEDGSVSAMASLLRFSVDMFTLQHCLLALCNLLSALEDHLPIFQQSMLYTLMTLSSQDNEVLKDFCALAFYYLCCAEKSRKHVVDAGAVVAIIDLARQKTMISKRLCAAALCNLSAHQQGMSRMVADGVIPALVNLVLADDLDTVRNACVALCRLCSTVDNAKLILDSDAVPNLVHRSIAGDDLTQQFCGAVLSALSFYKSCRLKLCQLNVLPALTSLSELNDEVTRQRCLVAFANLSCEMSIQAQMVNEGVVGIIAKLAANCYQEVNFVCCAKALCNLACSEDSRLRVAMEGGMHALMMISMVHSVNNETKLLCVIALGNLLDEATVEYMLGEGLVGSVANLAKIADTRTNVLCARLLNHLSFYPSARTKMVEKSSVLYALLEMLRRSENAETKVIAARTAANLVIAEGVRHRAIECDALSVLVAGVMLDNEQAVLHCVKVIFAACDEEKFMVAIAKSQLPLTLCKVGVKPNEEMREYAVKVLSLLAWKTTSRAFLIDREFAQHLIGLVNHNPSVGSARWITIALRYVTMGYRDRGRDRDLRELVQVDIVPALWRLHEIDTEETCVDISRSLAEIIRSIAEVDASALASVETIKMLRRAVDLCSRDAATMYHVIVALYKLSSESSESRIKTSIEEALTIIEIVHNFKECTELVIATLYCYLTDPKTRKIFANSSMASIVINVIAAKNNNLDEIPDEVLDNAISCVFALSKVPSCREVLVVPPLAADIQLIKLAQKSENPKIKASCARSLKNMASDSTEAVDEGAISTLIAMSLKGQAKGMSQNEFNPPEIMSHTPMASNKPPACINEVVDDLFWFDDKYVIKGGAAGKGPDAPEPPSMRDDVRKQYPAMNEEIDGGDVEGKTRMAFAKMQVPQSLRGRFLLTDVDFEHHRDDADGRDDDASSTGGGTALGAGSGCGLDDSLGPDGRLRLEPISYSSGNRIPSSRRGGDDPSSVRSRPSTAERVLGDGLNTSGLLGHSRSSRHAGAFKKTSSSRDLNKSGPESSLSYKSAMDASSGGRQKTKSKGVKKLDSIEGEISVPLGERAASLGLYA